MEELAGLEVARHLRAHHDARLPRGDAEAVVADERAAVALGPHAAVDASWFTKWMKLETRSRAGRFRLTVTSPQARIQRTMLQFSGRLSTSFSHGGRQLTNHRRRQVDGGGPHGHHLEGLRDELPAGVVAVGRGHGDGRGARGLPVTVMMPSLSDTVAMDGWLDVA